MFNWLGDFIGKILLLGYKPIEFEGLFTWTRYRGPLKNQYWWGRKAHPKAKRGYPLKSSPSRAGEEREKANGYSKLV